MKVWSLLLAGIAYCGAGGDPLDKKMAVLSSPRAVNCGRVEVWGNSKATNTCILKAVSSHQPFRARYDLQGIDSKVAVGVIGTLQGGVIEIPYDSMGFGGPERRECPMPLRLKILPRGSTTMVTCFEER